MQRVLVAGVLLAGFLAMSSVAAAEPQVIYPKHSVVIFDGDVIDGSLAKPDGGIITSRNRGRVERLFKVRASFRQELLQSLCDG